MTARIRTKAAAAGAVALLTWATVILGQATAAGDRPAAVAPVVALSANPTVAQIVDAVEHRAFLYFWEQSDPHTGITKDRADNFAPDTHTVGSIAATGYALAALPIGVENGWVGRKAAYDRALATLRFFDTGLPNDHGFYYHFIDWKTGARQWNCEISSIDTALFLLGALTVGSYFHGTEVDRLANTLYDRVDFDWMRTEGATTPNSPFLSMGYRPESGWISRWSDYNECPELYFLAMGSPTHPISTEGWDDLKLPETTVEGYPVIGGPEPIFIAQMPAEYFDYRGKRDLHGIDFWVNSVNAQLANRAFCISEETRFKTFSPLIWAVNACDLPSGYGAISDSDSDPDLDGTVCPSGEVAAISFIPDVALPGIGALYTQYGSKIWGRYGFSDAFNVDKNWYDSDVLGIDLGMAMLSIENSRTGLIWRLMAHTRPATVGMAMAGFHITNERGTRPLEIEPQTGATR